MGRVYGELVERRDYILKVIASEEERFNDTLDQGMEILKEELARIERAGETVLPGEAAFRLYDTYGFPLEITREIADEHGVSVDEECFQTLMDKQRERARQAREAIGYAGKVSARYARALAGITVSFAGYDRTRVDDARVVRILCGEKVVRELTHGEVGEVVLDVTSFYGESGGQVGDVGELQTPTGRALVLDTKKPSAEIVSHQVRVIEGRIEEGQECVASVDSDRRGDTARNHTATHLVHKSLKLVLGDHVAQAGSLVGPDRLRFDFSHLESMTQEQLAEVERLVNERIMDDLEVVVSEMSLKEATKSGATALFGEKYGDRVRVVSIGDFSRELCGGTHVRRTGQIGLFRILSESGIAAGVRRIEAVTGHAALEYSSQLRSSLRRIADILKSSLEDAPDRVDKLVSDLRDLEAQLASLKSEAANNQVSNMIDQALDVADAKVVVSSIDGLDHQQLRAICDEARDKLGSGVVLLSSSSGGKLSFISMVTKDLVDRGISAVDIVNSAARAAGGGGGGRPDMAQAGAKDLSRVGDAMQAGREYILSALNTMS